MPVGADGYGSSEDPAWRRIDWSSHEHTEEVAGRGLHYVDMGEGGTPCLLVHGIGNSWRFWLETLPQLAERRRMLALDLPASVSRIFPTARCRLAPSPRSSNGSATG